MSERKIWLLFLSLVFVVVLAACGGNNEPADADTNNNDAGTNNTSDKTNNEADESSGENSEGDYSLAEDQTLIFARGGDSVSLDYASVTDGESSRVTEQIYESLLKFDEDSFEIGPGLAEEWEVFDDGLRFVFQLREGVTFHDGTDFNAEAVKINFERWADPDHEYHFADEGYTYSVYGTQFGGFKGDDGHVIEEINVLGEHEIEFVLNESLGAFLQNMGMSYFSITSPAAFEEHGSAINENPVGTGPFKFVSWSKDDSIVLEKNEDYWQEGYPKLDGVIFQVIPDNSARLTALRSGEIDIMDGLNPDDVEQIESDPGLAIFERETNNIGYLGFNLDKEPFDNADLRRALNHAIDKETLITVLYAGLAEPAKNIIPPSYMGYNDSIDPYAYDPDLARELLDEAGFGDGLEFDLWTMPVARPYMPDPERAAEVMQANLADVGVTANIVSMEWATYLERTEQGEHDIFMLGWSGTNGDPDYFFGNLLHSDAIPGGNRSFYGNDEVDSLLNQAKNSVDEDERAELYREVQEIVHEDAPMIPLVHSIPVLAGSERVKNYVPHLSTSEPLTNVELAE
ncbi:ABC transporter substrate-binding protein [Salipaludibacillus aurantiacus]|uniref:Peptide/nickel transport system substrate-binding protein n=1 Tax=Salipaludibacillus aurantiacus TaxID=1601833 RepID=A0A1H9NVN9_9BACI|nr:ABC transporter substrate-binding protein [Salipaludibacillus aurantiacus]SER39978.1 peptide/nickel transport system substrate-binding protein [Salipaludibacillus aurantiacus]